MADLALDLKRELVAKRQRKEALNNEFEQLKAEANRVVGEAQGKIKENDVSLKWLEDTLTAAGEDTSPEALAKALADAAPPPSPPEGTPPAPQNGTGKTQRAGSSKGTAKHPKPAPEAPPEPQAQTPTPSA